MIDLISKLLSGIDSKAGRVLSLLIVAALAIFGLILPADNDTLNLEAEPGPKIYDPLDAVPTAVPSNAASFTTVVANDIEALDDLFVGDDVTIAGTLSNFSIGATSITTNTNITAAQSGSLIAFKNQSTFKVTATLPAASSGLHYCFFNYEGDDIEVDVQTGDQILILTNATGDEIDNTTAGDAICLVALDTTYWLKYPAATGTWSDD